MQHQQGFDGLPPAPADEHIACVYTNHATVLQILRIENIEGWYFERVVFPGQTLAFTATTEAIAQIFTCDHIGCLLDDHLRCSELRLRESQTSTASVA